MKRFIYSLMALTIIACSKPIPNEQVTAFYEELQQVVGDFRIMQPDMEQRVTQMIDSNEIKFSDLSFEQLQMSRDYRAFIRSAVVKEAINQALQKYIDQNDTIGARAAVLACSYIDKGHAETKALQAVAHPAFAQLLQNPNDAEDALIAGIAYMGEVEQSQVMGKLVEVLTPNVPKLDDNGLNKAMRVFQTAINDTNVTPEQLEALRVALVERNTKFKADGEAAQDGSMISYGKDYDALLNSAIAKGELMNCAAPEINFLWSTKKDLKKLSDLKGKVVVVDFWATWCGPCFRSFPNIRALQERYEGYDVEIVGVTSLQGRHVRRFEDGRTESVDTRNNPDEEYKLMKEFMKNHDMTWTVVFSEGSCFDKNYGVFGIPHVAIIDPEGVVRYNALRPYEAPFHEAEKIDALLKEAGKKAPKDPMSTENFAK